MLNEKKTEYATKSRQEIHVTQTPKYIASSDKALKAIPERTSIKESEYWNRMNESKTGKMGCPGLINNNNTCLKIHDNRPEKDTFNPECVTVNKPG